MNGWLLGKPTYFTAIWHTERLFWYRQCYQLLWWLPKLVPRPGILLWCSNSYLCLRKKAHIDCCFKYLPVWMTFENVSKPWHSLFSVTSLIFRSPSFAKRPVFSKVLELTPRSRFQIFELWALLRAQNGGGAGAETMKTKELHVWDPCTKDMNTYTYARGSTTSRRKSICLKCFQLDLGSPAAAPLRCLESLSFLAKVSRRFLHLRVTALTSSKGGFAYFRRFNSVNVAGVPTSAGPYSTHPS